MPNPAVTETVVELTTELWARRAFEKQLLNVIPDMRAFARFLVRNPTEADDLVQDAIVRALRAYRQFDLRTNIKAWVFTILRNARMNSLRTRPFEVLEDEDVAMRPTPPNQLHSVELREVLVVLATLKPMHREVLTLIRASGLSYVEAAQVMKCKIGTIKSRLSRADTALRDALGPDFHAPSTSRREPCANW